MPTKNYDTILAFDPGTATIGWAVIYAKGDRMKLAECGAIRTSKIDTDAERLLQIHDQTMDLIKKWEPDVVAMERLFFAKNQTTAIAVGKAVGVIQLAGAKSGLPIIEYTPPEVKMAVVGEGNADKKQVQYMVVRILKLTETPKPDDVADACAIGICTRTRDG